MAGIRKSLAVVAAGVMVVAACSSSKKSTSSPATAATGSTTAAAGPTTSSAPSAAAIPAPAGGTVSTLPTYTVAPVAGNTTTGITATEIHLGGVYTKSLFAGSDDGFNARLKRENDAGGIYGRKLVLDTMLDDGNSQTQALTASKTLVQEDHVFAVAPVLSGVFAGAGYLNDAKVPFFGWSIEPRWCGLNWAFGFEGDDCDLTKAALGLDFPPIAAKLFADGTVKGKTIAVIAGDNDSGHTSMLQFASTWRENGANVVFAQSDIPVAPTVVGDYTPFAEQILTADHGQPPDLLEIEGDFGQTLGLDKKLVALGYKGIVLGFTDYDPRIVGTSKGMVTVLQYAPFEQASDLPAVQQMVTDLKAYKPGILQSEAVASGYWTADFLIQALKKAGPNLSREALYNAINSGFTYDNHGAMDPVQWPVGHILIQVGAAFVQDEGTAYKVVVPLTTQGFIPNPLLNG